MTDYVSVKTGRTLVRKPQMFHFRGTDFHGLVDVEVNALYDDPSDSFAARVGMPSSEEQGLIIKKD